MQFGSCVSLALYIFLSKIAVLDKVTDTLHTYDVKRSELWALIFQCVVSLIVTTVAACRSSRYSINRIIQNSDWFSNTLLLILMYIVFHSNTRVVRSRESIAEKKYTVFKYAICCSTLEIIHEQCNPQRNCWYNGWTDSLLEVWDYHVRVGLFSLYVGLEDALFMKVVFWLT